MYVHTHSHVYLSERYLVYFGVKLLPFSIFLEYMYFQYRYTCTGHKHPGTRYKVHMCTHVYLMDTPGTSKS
jgi:hypothetical protein